MQEKKAGLFSGVVLTAKAELCHIKLLFASRWWPLRVFWKERALIESLKPSFFSHLAPLIGRLVCTDGRFSTEEVFALNHIIHDEFKLTAAQKIVVLQIVRRAERNEVPLGELFGDFMSYTSWSRRIRKLTLHLLMEFAQADGEVSDAERHFLGQLCKRFALSKDDYNAIAEKLARKRAIVAELEEIKKQREELSYAKFEQRRSRKSSETPLEEERSSYNAYSVLGCEPFDSDRKIKRAYRALVLQYHPDRFAAQDIPPEFQEDAKVRFRAIQEAYELIEKERGIS